MLPQNGGGAGRIGLEILITLILLLYCNVFQKLRFNVVCYAVIDRKRHQVNLVIVRWKKNTVMMFK